MIDKLRARHNRRYVPTGVAAETSDYDAFVSYSHARDDALARMLQTGLERFAKPWYRPCALRVFRDTTNLAANPNLWSSIEKALASSAWLVLMASPDAAQSKWVNREVEWWLANKSPQRLLVVLTEGEFAWNEDGGHGDGATAALPAALRGVFVEEPRWVDLRWARNLNQVAQSHPQLREVVADVAAPVRNVPKDVLVGEHLRQHRRTMRLARGGVTALAVLLIVAVVAAWVATGERNQAVGAQRTTIARGMMAEADRIREANPRGALQLGVAANQLDPSPQTQASLMQTLMSSRYRGTLTDHTNEVDSVVFSPDGRTLATASSDGSVILWDLSDRNQLRRLGPPLTGHTAAALSPDRHTMATTSVDGSAILWNLSDRSQPSRLGQPLTGHTEAVVSVAFSPDGRTMATGGADRSVILWDVTDRAHPRHLSQVLADPGWVVSMVFSPDGVTLATASGDRTIILWDVSDRSQPRRLGQPLAAFAGSVAFSPDGRTLAIPSEDWTVTLWDLTDRNQPRQLGRPLTGHADFVVTVAFSPDERTLATASTDRTVILWDLSDRSQPRRLGQLLIGHIGTVDSVAFSPDGRILATASGDQTVTLWDMTVLAELRRDAVNEACIRAGGPLDKVTWDFYAPGVNYQDNCADR